MIRSCLALLFLTQQAHALVVTDSFTSTANLGTSQMVWNIASGGLHAPLYVSNYDRGFGPEDYPFSVGDGRHGSFATAAEYDNLACASVAGFSIIIDTDVCDDLQFTRFHLQAGWTVTPTGSKPLLIRSLSTVIVDGTINCSGGNGNPGNSTFGSVRAGGIGRCGGGDGGDSVLPSVAPGVANAGEAGGGFVTGGGGGPIQDAGGGKGGGGGGAYVKNFVGGADSPDGTHGKDSGGVDVGNRGSNYRDDAYDDDVAGAGSGGGGGSGFQSGADPGNSSGGGGGAGGGAVLIYAVDDVTVTGSILADGGNGGAVANPFKAGGGGGGGGGSILIMTAGDIVNDGTISAVAGSGGSSFSTADGGDGYWGRTWIVETGGFASGLSIESPETQLNSPGDVRFETGVNYTVISDAIDLGSSRPTIISASSPLQNPGAATLTFEVAFGDSLSDPDLSNFALPATYVGLEVGRFARFRIQLDNQDGINPVAVTEVNFDFDGFLQNNFEFTGACGQVHGNAKNKGNFIWILPLLIFLILRRFAIRYQR